MPTSSSGYVNPYDTLGTANPSKLFNLPTATPAMQGSATGQGGYAPGAAPNLESITSLVNSLNLQSQKASNEARIPGASGLETQSSNNIGAELGGRLPQDVITQLQQRAAERGVAMGSPGSDNSNAAYLRALGLNSLDLQQRGQTDLSRAYARNPGAPIFDPTSQLLTPAQAGALNSRNAELQLDWYRALTGGGGGGGSRGGGGGGAPTTQDVSQGSNWFSNLMRGTPSSSDVTPPPTVQGRPGYSPSTPIANPSGLGYDIAPPPNSGVGYDISTPGFGLGYDQTSQPFDFFAPQPSVGYDTGLGGLGDNFGVGYDQTSYDPFSQL